MPPARVVLIYMLAEGKVEYSAYRKLTSSWKTAAGTSINNMGISSVLGQQCRHTVKPEQNTWYFMMHRPVWIYVSWH